MKPIRKKPKTKQNKTNPFSPPRPPSPDLFPLPIISSLLSSPFLLPPPPLFSSFDVGLAKAAERERDEDYTVNGHDGDPEGGDGSGEGEGGPLGNLVRNFKHLNLAFQLIEGAASSRSTPGSVPARAPPLSAPPLATSVAPASPTRRDSSPPPSGSTACASLGTTLFILGGSIDGVPFATI